MEENHSHAIEGRFSVPCPASAWAARLAVSQFFTSKRVAFLWIERDSCRAGAPRSIGRGPAEAALYDSFRVCCVLSRIHMSEGQAMHDIEILAPTSLEYWATRCILPRACVQRAGVSLARWQRAGHAVSASIVIVCGLAGALVPDLRPGTVLIPEQAGLPSGELIPCDPVLVQTLVTAARGAGFQPETGPLLTASSLIVGAERSEWVRRGFVAADMETGLLAEQNLRVATVRVILDTPEHNISQEWLQPARAMRQLSLWRELFWLSHAAPRYALRAARVLKYGLDEMR
jgi:hypothetical protein